MKKDWKTTLVAVLIFVSTVATAAVSWLTTGSLDWQTIGGAVMGLLAALGFWKAADSKP